MIVSQTSVCSNFISSFFFRMATSRTNPSRRYSAAQVVEMITFDELPTDDDDSDADVNEDDRQELNQLTSPALPTSGSAVSAIDGHSRLILGAFPFFAPISVLVSGELRHVQAIPAAVSVPSRRKEEGDRSDLYDMIVVQTSVCFILYQQLFVLGWKIVYRPRRDTKSGVPLMRRDNSRVLH